MSDCHSARPRWALNIPVCLPKGSSLFNPICQTPDWSGGVPGEPAVAALQRSEVVSELSALLFLRRKKIIARPRD